MSEYRCSECEVAKESIKAPRGWRIDPHGAMLCDACWAASYQSRCIVLPIAGPYLAGERTKEDQDTAWETLRHAMHAAWDASTRLANWAVTELLRNEPARSRDDRLPKLDAKLYQAFGSTPIRPEWDGMTQSANAVMRWAEAKYRTLRSQIQGTYSAQSPTFRWPAPYPVPAKGWSARVECGHVLLTVPLGGQRLELRVRNDRTSPIHQARIREIIAGDGKAGELRLVARTVQPNDRRNGITLRKPGGRETRYVRIMAMISAAVPVRVPTKGGGPTMLVRTGNESLLYADVEGDDEPWVVHGDHIRRWVIASAAMRQRWSDDTKAECRIPARKRRRRVDAGDRHNEKYRRRLQTAAEEVSAWVVNYAQRRRASVIVYDDSERGFCPAFGYAGLRELIFRKAKDAGIEITASDPVPAE